jgi:pimeloyl-ACP methyl ester carboxylesterase
MVFPALGHDKYLAALARERNFRPFAVAAVNGGESYWHHRAGGEDRMAMFVQEFAPLVHRLLNLGPGADESLLGYSMGGYGALLAAIREPHRYRAVAVAGPAIWSSFDQQHAAVPDAFDNREDFDRNSIFASASALQTQAVRIDCGRSDPFVENVELFHKAVPRAVVSVRDGCHDDTLFRSAVPDQLRFIASRMAHGGQE